MNAANKFLLTTSVALVGMSVSQAAEAQYFSSEGRSGHYADMFLAGTQKTSIEQNVLTTVRVSNNFGEIEIRDFVVNCNRHNAQVLDDANVNHRIRVKQTPSSAEKFTWELWQAACRKEFAKISKRAPPSTTLEKLPDQVSISFDGSLFSIPVKQSDRKENLSNLVEAKVDAERVSLYCDTDNGTAYWADKKALVGIGSDLVEELNGDVSAELVSRSQALWNGICRYGLDRVASNKTTPVEPPTKPTEQVADVKPDPLASSSSQQPHGEAAEYISTVYETYILAKAICDLSYSGSFGLNGAKARMKEMDNFAGSKGIDIQSLWDKATNKMEKDADYKLFQLYKTMPIEPSDRVRFSGGCSRITPLITAGVDSYLSKFAGQSGIKKDF
ncbi:hypothetical protein BS627_01145 [Agrobacterium salinitolerans]|uniref:hypothetical protein n=1 Tax=Agrobacterium salinitolerans TaxID=1183413 RepID=UPI00098F571D|nr:hypothetical protein [Agrobacterium salinitolerans]OOO28794.1 hypothetical protein BS627_01145 [Agrobacterium salinitolerans]PNQ26350.1 hypothetical protein C2E26_01165 [Rhizobium sp. YIC5082]